LLDIYTMFSVRFFFLSFLLVLCIHEISAQTLSNRGREFWLGYGFNYSFLHESPVNGQEMQLYISAIQAAQVTVSVSNTSYSKTFSIPANSVDFSITLPKSGLDDARILKEGLMNRGVSIISDVPVAVYAHQYNAMVSGATMLIPKESYGYSYYSVNYAQHKSGSKHPYDATVQMTNGDDWYSWFYVVSPEDGTRVRITPSDTTQSGWLPGQSYTVDLKKGEIYNVMGKLRSRSGPNWNASKDMTGSKIVSVAGTDGKCHPIAVFSGSGGIRLCRGDGGEYMGQQMLPSRAWGTRYATYHMVNNTQTDVTEPILNFYRVCVMNPSTLVKKNGIPMTGLVNNFYYEFFSYTGDYIEADKPILVSQYTPNRNQCVNMNSISYGDPEMIYLSPIEQGQNNILFFTPRKAFIDYVYGNIYLPTIAVSSLKVDGNPLPPANITPHPTLAGYSVALARFTGSAAHHTVTCDSIFNAYIYGIGLFESYGFTAGTQVNDLNSYANIRNTQKADASPDTATCPKTPFRAQIQVAYALSSIKWRFSEVPGLFPSKDTLINNPELTRITKVYGRNYYTYDLNIDLTLSNPGVYEIPYTYTSPDIDQCDFTESGTVKVVVRAGPRADFDTSRAFCLQDTAMLVADLQSNGFNLTRYRWDFPDSSSQLTRDARKRFQTGGLFPVRFRIFADNGCAGDTTKHVKVNELIKTDFSYSGKPCQDSTLTFQSSMGIKNMGGVWYWSVVSGRTDSSRTDSTFRYSWNASVQNVTVRHWLSGPDGCLSDTSIKTIPVIHATPLSPSIIIKGDTLCPGNMVSFDAQVGYTPSRWEWDLGDNIFINTPAPVSRAFPLSGRYQISLKTWSPEGCGAPTTSSSVEIAPQPTADAGPDRYILLGSSAPLASPMNPANGFRYLWEPATGLDDPTLRNPMCTPATDMKYILTVWDKVTHCADSDTLDVFVLTKITVPNTFTPNNDGINDFWDIRFLDRYPSCRVEVYSTTGQPVWRSTGYVKPWDGSSQGRPLPAGTYYYVIDPGNGDAKLAGYVTLLK
jgi:gliding motility-associated-like protein